MIIKSKTEKKTENKIENNSVFVQAAALTMSSLLLQILLFVYRIIITRFSGAGGMGVFQLAMPYYSILASVSLSGITVAVSRLTVEKTTVGEEYKTNHIVQNALRLFLILLSACAVLTFLFPDLVSGKILGDIRTKASMLLLIPCLFLTGFENIYKSFFYGAKFVKPNIISEPVELIIRIAAVFTLLYMNQDNLTPEKTAFLMVSAMIASEIFSFIFLSAYYKIYQNKRGKQAKINRIDIKTDKSMRHSGRKSKSILSEIARIAVPICASSVLMTIISSVNTIMLPKRLVVSGMTHTQAIETLGILMGMSMPDSVK